MKSSNDVWLCDFCGKNQHSVEKMVTGPDGVAICNECVELSIEAIAETRAEKKRRTTVLDLARSIASRVRPRR
jgi:ATP-dependent protease Clp ATPase subunit